MHERVKFSQCPEMKPQDGLYNLLLIGVTLPLVERLLAAELNLLFPVLSLFHSLSVRKKKNGMSNVIHDCIVNREIKTPPIINH